MIAESGWDISDLLEAIPITRETQLAGGMKYFDQAEIDNEVLVFHAYPHDSDVTES